MKPSYLTALIVGAITGLVLALALTLFVGATGGLPSITAVQDGTRVMPVFAPPASALWFMVILASAVGGFVTAAVTRAVARVIDPDASSASLAVIAPLGSAVAAVVGMSVFPLGSVVFGAISEGTVTLTVVELLALAGVTGLVAGAVIAWSSYVLARPPVASEDKALLPATIDRSA